MKVSVDRIPLILPFNHAIYPSRRIILRHHKTIMTDQNIKDIFKSLPIASYKREPNISNHLFRASHPQLPVFIKTLCTALYVNDVISYI